MQGWYFPPPKLVVIEKTSKGLERRVITEVLYINLRGIYGVDQQQAI